MKKNLISIGILVLLIINLVLTGIMMFSVMSTNKKTAALVTDIATAINLELSIPQSTDEEPVTINMSDIATYTIADMMIPLKNGVNEDGTTDKKDHYAVLSVSLSMNINHDDYKTYGEDVASKEDLIKGQINDVISKYTVDEVRNNSSAICDEILARIQSLYGSDFIFDVSFSSSLYQ